jgi:iron complex outermembrane receptor protein
LADRCLPAWGAGLLALLLLAAASPARAQTPDDASAATGAVAGRVASAETGAALAGVNVALVGTERGASTDDDGTFAIEAVAPGTYTLVASFVGYAPARRSIRVEAGATTRVDVQLSVSTASLSEVVVLERGDAFVATDATTLSKADAALADVPQSASVVTRAQLAIRDVERLSEVLRYVPGVQGETFGFEPRLTFVRFRGFDATTAGLYRDGLQLRNPGFAIGYSPEPYAAERVEVARGPASVLYGAASPGGLVNVVSKRPTRERIGEVAFETGSFNRLEGRLDVGGPIDPDGVVTYRLTGLVREGGTQVDFVDNDRLFVAPAVTLRPTPSTTLTFLGRIQRDETRSSQRLPVAGTLEDNPASGTIPVDQYLGEPDVDRYDRYQRSVGYLFEQGVGERVKLQQKLRYYAVDLDDVTVFGSALRDDNRTLDRLLFESFGTLGGLTLDNQAQVSLETGRVRQSLLAGLDFQQVGVTSEQNFGGAPPIDIFAPTYGAEVPEAAPFADTATDQRQVGLYLQDRITVFERLVVTLNGRYDWAITETQNLIAQTRTRQRDEAFTGRAGLVVRAPFGLSPYGSYTTSFLPALGTDADGEPFDPERGRQIELGIKAQPPGLQSFMTVALFSLDRDDFLQTNPATFLQEQTGDANARGLEVEGLARTRFGLDVQGSLTLQDVEITASNAPEQEGERPTQVRERMASLWADYTLPDGVLRGLGAGAGVRYLGPSFGDVPNTLEAPSATLVDAALYYTRYGVRLQVNANNVLDNEYIASTFVAGPQGFATYGAVRRITVALSYGW